jgi:acyl carrier protein
VDDQDRKEHAQTLIDYLVHQVIRRPGLQITEDSPLVSSGLIDSLALVQILMKVEDVTARRIPAGKVQPKDMDTVSLVLDTAERVGTPRKR